MSFNRSRGCAIRRHPTGIQVAMYYDEPGTYYDINGRRVNPDLARKCGFDVDRDTKNAELQHRKREALAAVEREFASIQDNIMRAIREESDVHIREVSSGRYSLFDADGNKLSVTKDMTWDEAVILYRSFTGKEAPTVADNPPNLGGPTPGPNTPEGKKMQAGGSNTPPPPKKPAAKKKAPAKKKTAGATKAAGAAPSSSDPSAPSVSNAAPTPAAPAASAPPQLLDAEEIMRAAGVMENQDPQ